MPRRRARAPWPPLARFGVLVVVAGLLGAAVSPADVSPAVHLRSAALASATAPLALLLCAAASARDRRLPRGVSVVWVVLAVTVAAWFAMRWRPGVDNSVGLTIQATSQKGVALVVVIGLAYQTYQAIRALAAVEGKMSPGGRCSSPDAITYKTLVAIGPSAHGRCVARPHAEQDCS